MNHLNQQSSRHNERGQILLMFTIALPVLVLFVGLAIDFGFVFVTKTTLSSAVDAAALAAMRNVNQGPTQATAIGVSAFNVNYHSGFGRDSKPAVISVGITTDASNNPVINVAATATVSTYFLRVLPGFETLNISSSSQATRPKLIVSLVLDKSGSMNKNGGAAVLAPAVTNFLSYFVDSTDQFAMVDFSSIPTVDVSIRSNFTSPITSAVNGLTFGGGTYTQGGLLGGQSQINSVITAPGENVVKVAVFFTDGWANTLQDTLNCPPSTTMNFGGCSPPEAAVGWCGGISFMNPSNGNSTSCGATKFPSQVTKTMISITQANIAADAMYRAVQVANSMRAQNIQVYSIGLGNKISQPFLQQVANDPASSTFDATQPVGQAVFAPSPADLQGVFQTIASKIVYRLSK